jgi:queuine/archaeosine tRNA-ribosyltransferase
MSFRFEVEGRDGKARAGRMVTPHGVIDTPVFMPVGTLGTVKAVPQDVLEELGVQILLNNTYHLYLRPGVEMVRALGGVQRFMAWDKPILTDSGGFQVFSLSELRKVTEEGVAFRSHLDGSSHMFTPESSIAAQIGLGADIIMAFDECTEHPASRERARSSMEMTLRWLKRSRDYFEEHKEEVVWVDGVTSGAEAPDSYRAGNGTAKAVPLQSNGSTAGPSTARSSVPQLQRVEESGERFAQDDTTTAGPFGRLRAGSSTRTAIDRAVLAQDDADSGVPTSSFVVASGHTQALFGIVQGGMYPDLRRESAERTVEIDLPGYAIGGLSVGEPRNVTYNMVDAAIPYLPANKPRYLMGVGTPEEIVHYVAQGVDMMDCVLPTRAARHGLLFTSEGKLTIKNAQFARDEGPIDPKCGCKVCARYSRAYLRHLYASNELLAQTLNTVHNLAYYLDTMRRVRQAILLGEFATFLSGVRPPHLSVP